MNSNGSWAYLQRLMALERQASFHRVAVRCICTLIEAVPHFNFRESLLASVIKNISSSDDVVRKYCCGAIKSLFTNEGKHSGEATVEAVQLIANLVKIRDCQLHPDSIEVFMVLSFDEDLGRPESSKADKKVKNKKYFKIFKKGKRGAESNRLLDERQTSKQELMSEIRDEVNADFKSASLTLDTNERKRMQSDGHSLLCVSDLCSHLEACHAVTKYQAYDPHLSGALASVLWELNLVSKHYHPTVATKASTILTLSSEHTQLYHPKVSPQQAFMEMSLENESYNLKECSKFKE